MEFLIFVIVIGLTIIAYTAIKDKILVMAIGAGAMAMIIIMSAFIDVGYVGRDEMLVDYDTQEITYEGFYLCKRVNHNYEIMKIKDDFKHGVYVNIPGAPFPPKTKKQITNAVSAYLTQNKTPKHIVEIMKIEHGVAVILW